MLEPIPNAPEGADGWTMLGEAIGSPGQLEEIGFHPEASGFGFTLSGLSKVVTGRLPWERGSPGRNRLKKG